tara:strand:- start:3373 stop:3681 length:309 start_codon:yes stop_codon:yes gene_type:complete
MKSYEVNESDKERIRNLHRNHSVIKEQPYKEDGQIYLDPTQDFQAQLDQIIDNQNGNIISELTILIEELKRKKIHPKMLTHRLIDRLSLIAEKINNGEYLTL